MHRREFFQKVSAGAAAGPLAGFSPGLVQAGEEIPPELSFGVVTDVHYADIPSRKSRHYGKSLEKLQQAVSTFRKRGVSFIIELGDFIDADPGKVHDADYLQAVRKVFEGFPGPRYYVLGNHCVWVLGKEKFLAGCGQERSWYSFDGGAYHGVVLDACFGRDGLPYLPGEFDWKDSWIPRAELDWLAEDLAQAKGQTVLVFVHQNLHDESRPCGVKNGPEVRAVLEGAGNVLAVFQGHEHPGAYARIGGIHYFTLHGMIEGEELTSNSYGIVHCLGQGRLRIEGFGQQPHFLIRD